MSAILNIQHIRNYEFNYFQHIYPRDLSNVATSRTLVNPAVISIFTYNCKFVFLFLLCKQALFDKRYPSLMCMLSEWG